ncbi:MAG TPA: hypothetical protein VFP65_13310, partial [Anaeromyxobacteraceae bacterium]|nr:hypothetical protein [Anaeromyxobacteraceae bacterium]
MPFSRLMAIRLLAFGLVPAGLAWYVSASFFPLTSAQRSAVDTAAVVGLAVLAAVASAAVLALTRPVARGLAPP